MNAVRILLALVLAVMPGCSSGDNVKLDVTIEVPVLFPDFPLATPTEKGLSAVVATQVTPALRIASFTISSELCSNSSGPDCRELPLGDDYLVTDAPARGYLYSCNAPNPSAPGARERKITWINYSDKTWNFLEKLWLPAGTFNPGIGAYSENVVGIERRIDVNNLPLDEKIGDWPMTQYPMLTEIDGNLGVPFAKDSSFSYIADPSVAHFPTCVSLGTIGVTKNGVVLYNAADGRGEDALAREILDVFGGHPAINHYHYHYIPVRLDSETLDGGHSGIVGYISDGFPIYGYRGDGGREMSNEELDECHGHDHGSLGYHYHATIEYPYTVGCYKGASVEKLFVR